MVMDQETVKMRGVTEVLNHPILMMKSYGTESGKNKKLFGEKRKNSSCYKINRWKVILDVCGVCLVSYVLLCVYYA